MSQICKPILEKHLSKFNFRVTTSSTLQRSSLGTLTTLSSARGTRLMPSRFLPRLLQRSYSWAHDQKIYLKL